MGAYTIFTSRNTNRNAGSPGALWRRWLPSVLLAAMFACNPPPPPSQAEQTWKINELQTQLTAVNRRADEAATRAAALTTENTQLKERVAQLEANVPNEPGPGPAGAVACIPPEAPAKAGGKRRRGRTPSTFAMVTSPGPTTTADSSTSSSLPPPPTVVEPPPPPETPTPPPAPPSPPSDPAAQAAKAKQQQINTLTTECTAKKREKISVFMRTVDIQAKQNRAAALETLKEEERKAGRSGCEQGQCSVGAQSSDASKNAQKILQGKNKGGIARALQKKNPTLFSKNKALLSSLAKDSTTEDPGEDETVATSILSALQTIDKECDEKIRTITQSTTQKSASRSSQNP